MNASELHRKCICTHGKVAVQLCVGGPEKLRSEDIIFLKLGSIGTSDAGLIAHSGESNVDHFGVQRCRIFQ